MTDRADLVRRAYETAARLGYLETDWEWFFADFVTNDLELDVSMAYPDTAGVYKGIEGWREFWREFALAWGDWTMALEDVHEARNGLVISLIRVVAEGHESGVAIDRKEAHAWTFRGDRVCSIVAWPDRAQAYRDLGVSM